MSNRSKSTEDRAVLARVARRLNKGRFGASMWLMTDQPRLPDPIAAIKALPRGTGIVIRDYDHPDRRAHARLLVKAAHSFGQWALVAGDPALARACGADGVHLPRHLHHLAFAVRRDWPAALITAAAHNHREVVSAARCHVDAVFISPVFATQSHPGASGLGLGTFQALARLAQSNGLIVFALGGVDKKTAPRLIGTGADGLAAIGALA